MQIKFQKRLLEYSHILMFDLASHNTGVCLWGIRENAPVFTTTITVRSNGDEIAVKTLFDELTALFERLYDMEISRRDVLVCKEAMPIQVRGGSSTMQTFLSLARSHAILDLFVSMNGIDVYDYVGVYPISTHSYLKKLVNFEHGYKIQKQDIKNYVLHQYNIKEDLSFDEYDAVFLAQTLVRVKWNKDLQEEIKATRRHCKTLKSDRGILCCQQEEERLRGLLVPEN